jgi:putative resolvase
MNEKNKEGGFVSIREASKFSGLDNQTIRKMFDLSQVNGYRTPAGQRRINLSSLEKMCYPNLSNVKISEGEKQNFLYARVSTKRQMDDLSRQIEFISRPEYSSYTLIQDIGSGINFKRKGIQTILDTCLQGNIGEIIIAHRDRLCRFAFELVETIVNKSGGTIKVLDCERNKSDQDELSQDLLSIIHIFNCRQMGKRSYKRKPKVQDSENPDIPNPYSETKT